MTRVSVFEFKDYKTFLKAFEQQKATIMRGFRSRLAEALNCQNAYVSQVLNTAAHFSLEQGIKIAEFLNFNEAETKYFLLLIEAARAGTPTLRNFFKKEIQNLSEQHLNIKQRVPEATVLTSEQQSIYYSSWLYSAAHILVTIPNFRTASKIADALGISQETTRDILVFLSDTGLVLEKNGELFPGPTQIHLGKDSSQIRQHHTSWRTRAIQSFYENKKTDIHYSTVSSLSHEDVENLRHKFVQTIQEYVATIRPSKEETLYSFSLDFYSLIK